MEEGIEDAFKIEIIGTHHGHGLACFCLVKKQALGGKSVGLSYSGMSKKFFTHFFLSHFRLRCFDVPA